MHESIGLAIITGDEAKALHAVKELDRAGCAFTGQLTLRRFRALFDSDHIAHDHQVTGRNLAAAIHQGEFQLLAFSKAFQPGALNRADVHKHIFAAFITLNEAKTLLAIEELYSSLALANDLGGHAAASAAAASTAAWAAEAATTAAAARATEATAIAAAEAATITAAETAAVTAAEAITATAAKTIATATAASHEGIKAAFVSETVALVTAPAATSSIKTHKLERTFASPLIELPGGADESRQTTGQMGLKPVALHCAI